MRTALLEIYPWIKALHLIFVVAWMAGMMYLPRLFVYHTEAKPGGEAVETFIKMERRLLRGIINPSMIMVWLLGLTMVYANPALMSAHWFWVKFACAVGISGVHGYYAWARRKLEKGERPRSSVFWRIMNEAPFLLFIVIAIMVIVRPF